MSHKFLNNNFFLENETARVLYSEYAEPEPLIDYHCHLDPKDIADDRSFDNLGQAWLAHDHYKWRAMRLNGVEERFCTGEASDKDKFVKWASTVPYLPGNPLYVWTHLELRRYFDTDKLLGPDTAEQLFEHCSALLRTPEYSARNLLRRMHVKVVCTTDDPCDNLQWHAQLRSDGFEIAVLPTFRPDRARIAADPKAYAEHMDRLGEAAGIDITSYPCLVESLRNRHRFFADHGCRSSDHSLQPPRFEAASDKKVHDIFVKVRGGNNLTDTEEAQLDTAILLELARMDCEENWVMQLHVGARRNLCTRLFTSYGPDAGGDAIGDHPIGEPLRRLLDELDSNNQLPKTIVYNLNPRDSELVLSILGSFARGPVEGKMQYGPPWWFSDHRDGIQKHLNALSAQGLLRRFAGMVTDSRSLLSYPRHEYFRRILCEHIGRGVEQGEIPDSIELLGNMVQDICSRNAVGYFGFVLKESIPA